MWGSCNGEVESGKGVVTYYYNGTTGVAEVADSVVSRPTYIQLFEAIQ